MSGNRKVLGRKIQTMTSRFREFLYQWFYLDAIFHHCDSFSVRPSPPTISSCSPNGTVPANASVTCTCTASSVGQPQGRLKWVKVADGSQITVGSYGTTTLKMTSQTLTLSDHDVNKFRCDVEWVEAVRGEGFRASVGCEWS